MCGLRCPEESPANPADRDMSPHITQGQCSPRMSEDESSVELRTHGRLFLFFFFHCQKQTNLVNRLETGFAITSDLVSSPAMS